LVSDSAVLFGCRAVLTLPGSCRAGRRDLIVTSGEVAIIPKDRGNGVSTGLSVPLDLSPDLLSLLEDRRIRLGLLDPVLQARRISSVAVRPVSWATMSSWARRSSVIRTASVLSWPEPAVVVLVGSLKASHLLLGELRPTTRGGHLGAAGHRRGLSHHTRARCQSYQSLRPRTITTGCSLLM
jgi:hypothetical protein